MCNLNTISFIDWGQIDYSLAWKQQERYLSDKVNQKKKNVDLNTKQPIENHLIFCEHPPVYTLGKSGRMENVLFDVLEKQKSTDHPAEFYKINRGGDITFHGPGQLVGYPILDLEQFFRDVHKYLRLIEQSIIDTLEVFGINAGRYEGYTGVWIEPNDELKARKICAIGVRCSRWVTMHGFALNINTNLSYFDQIVPCGIKNKKVTSMQNELQKRVDMDEVKAVLLQKFAHYFKAEITHEKRH